VPEYVDLLECAHCEEFLIGGKWIKFSSVEDAVEEAAVRSIVLRKGARIEGTKAEIRPQDSKNFLVAIDSKVKYLDLHVDEHLETVVRLKRGVCPRCSKIMGSYYESILQVRTRGRKFSDEEKEQILSEIEARVDHASKSSRDMFISKVEEMHGGLDIYLSSNSLGKSLSREVAEKYGAEVKESSSLLGQKDGKEIFRVTYLVRLPSYRVGDTIIQAGRPYLIGGIGSRGTRLIDLRTHESMNINNADLRSAKVVGTRNEELDAVVLTESDKEFEVMDPRNFKPVEIKKTQGFKRKGESVRVFPYEGELLLLPNSCQTRE
jgi:nonsense-mediated mRNA decay protein 3